VRVADRPGRVDGCSAASRCRQSGPARRRYQPPAAASAAETPAGVVTVIAVSRHPGAVSNSKDRPRITLANPGSSCRGGCRCGSVPIAGSIVSSPGSLTATPKRTSGHDGLSERSTRRTATAASGRRASVKGLTHRGDRGSRAGLKRQYVDTSIAATLFRVTQATIAAERRPRHLHSEFRRSASTDSNVLTPQGAWRESRCRGG
jgi:hypothetical protein